MIPHKFYRSRRRKLTRAEAARRQTPAEVMLKLRALARTDFNPDDYKNLSSHVYFSGYCKICGTQYAPGAVCGYCRCDVRRIRKLDAANEPA